jgi:phage terminase large subunit-like protein
MAIYDTVRNTITCAVDTVSSVTQTIIEKNRTKAQMNRLRTIMKNEAEMINRAYITLGKKYYENKINNMRDTLKNWDINAVNDHQYDYAVGTAFGDLVGELEKLGDYIVNVVEARFGQL